METFTVTCATLHKRHIKYQVKKAHTAICDTDLLPIPLESQNTAESGRGAVFTIVLSIKIASCYCGSLPTKPFRPRWSDLITPTATLPQQRLKYHAKGSFKPINTQSTH